MIKPEDIPQDVWDAAVKCAETACRNLPDDYGDITVEVIAIARAIMAERERCAKYHDDWRDKHYALARSRPDDADFHNEMALRARVHAAAIRKGAA